MERPGINRFNRLKTETGFSCCLVCDTSIILAIYTSKAKPAWSANFLRIFMHGWLLDHGAKTFDNSLTGSLIPSVFSECCLWLYRRQMLVFLTSPELRLNKGKRDILPEFSESFGVLMHLICSKSRFLTIIFILYLIN
jgi:hypothetical protein